MDKSGTVEFGHDLEEVYHSGDTVAVVCQRFPG